MSEDPLKRFHTPDKAAVIRGSSEAGFKKEWEDIFHPEELPDRIASFRGERIPGGGENALDILFNRPDEADPELRLLFADFLQDVYAISDKEELQEASYLDRDSLDSQYQKLLNTKSVDPKTLTDISRRVGQINYLIDEGLEDKLRKNFVTWFNTEEGEKVDYDLRGVSLRIIRRIKKKEKARLRKQKVTLTPDLKSIRKDHRFEMETWLKAWTDSEANVKAFGMRFDNGNVASVALLSDKYGVTQVPFNDWSQSLGGKRFLSKKNGVAITGTDFGKAHIIAPGLGEAALKETIRTLEISGVSHSQIPVKIIRE